MPLITTSTGKPRVILGCMTFGPDAKDGARIHTVAEYKDCLDHLQGAGYNEIDTARVYCGGKQEDHTAQAGWKQRGLKLATKWYPVNAGDHTAEKVKGALNTSLKELGTDCVDIFYLHAADRSLPFDIPLRACNELFQEGKFVQLGLSNFTSFEVAEIVMTCKANGWVRPTIYQGMYNAIMRNIETELIPACKRYGLEIVTYNPLAGGLFSGKVKSQEVPADGRFSSVAGTMGAMYRQRYFKDATFDALRLIEPVAEQHGISMLEIALRWMVHHSALRMGGASGPGPDGILVGVSSIEQLKSNLANAEKGPLPDEVIKTLDEAWAVCKPTSVPYWHKDLEYTYDTQAALFGAK